MKKYIFPVCVTLVFLGLLWVGGLDFNVRGPNQAMGIVISVYAGVMTWLLAGLNK